MFRRAYVSVALILLGFFLIFNADYGSSFPDIIQGVEHILENLGSDKVSEPSSFKYRATLENQVWFLNLVVSKHFHWFHCEMPTLLPAFLFLQLTSTTLHILGLVSCSDPQPLKDFLVKVRTDPLEFPGQVRNCPTTSCR